MSFDLITIKTGRHLSVPGCHMLTLLLQMEELGMVADGYPADSIPMVTAYEARNARLTGDPDLDRAVYDEFERAQSWRPSSADGDGLLPGIAAHKLRSCNHWWVTAEECRESVEAWRRHVADCFPCVARIDLPHEHLVAVRHVDHGGVVTSADAWLKWVDYLRGAATDNGFTVW